jgi:hypothetical protein
MKAILEKQTAILESVEKNLTQDKLIQLSQVTEQAKLDRDLNKNNDTMNSNLEKLYKEVKDLNKGLSKRDKEIRGKKAEEITEKAQKIKTYDTLGDKFQAKKEKAKDFFTVRGFLDQTGIAKRGGEGTLSKMADRAEAKKTFVKQQLEVTKNTFVKGSPEEKIRAKAAGKQFEQSQTILKENKKNEAKIEKMKEGGWGEDQIKKTGLMDTRELLTSRLKKVDKRFSDVGNDKEEKPTAKRVSDDSKEKAKKETVKPAMKKEEAEKPTRKMALKPEASEEKGKKETAKLSKKKEESTDTSQESSLEAQRALDHQIELLTKIEENTRPATGGEPNKKKEEPKGGGFLEMITNFLGEGFMSAIKTMFSPKNILKFLGKAFAITMIIGSLVNGIMDGWKEFTETGDIGKALIKGLGGVLEFLTFGLFDAKTVQNIVDAVSGFVDEYIIQPVTAFAEMLGEAFDKYIKQPFTEFMEPISGFFKNIKDSIVNFVTGFEIPKVAFTIPVIKKEVSFGPFRPFASDKASTSPEAPAPTAANAVSEKSASNAEAAGKPAQASGAVVVNAPTNVNSSKQNITMPAPVRNNDSGFNRYTSSRFIYG